MTENQTMGNTLPSAFRGRSISEIPEGTSSFMCAALVKPGSKLAEEWKLEKPAWCIYEYQSWAVEKHEIRWGDGSWQQLGPEDLDSIILLREFGDAELNVLFAG